MKCLNQASKTHKKPPLGSRLYAGIHNRPDTILIPPISISKGTTFPMEGKRNTPTRDGEMATKQVITAAPKEKPAKAFYYNFSAF